MTNSVNIRKVSSQDVEILSVLAAWQSHITKPEEQSQPTANVTGPTGGNRPDPTARCNAEELKTGMSALMSYVAGAGSTNRRPDNGGFYEPFVFLPFGAEKFEPPEGTMEEVLSQETSPGKFVEFVELRQRH